MPGISPLRDLFRRLGLWLVLGLGIMVMGYGLWIRVRVGVRICVRYPAIQRPFLRIKPHTSAGMRINIAIIYQADARRGFVALDTLYIDIEFIFVFIPTFTPIFRNITNSFF